MKFSKEVQGTIFDLDKCKPVQNTKVTLYNNKNEEVLETYSADDGTFNLDINCEEDIYKVVTFKEGYHFGYNLLANANTIFPMTLEVSLRRRN